MEKEVGSVFTKLEKQKTDAHNKSVKQMAENNELTIKLKVAEDMVKDLQSQLSEEASIKRRTLISEE